MSEHITHTDHEHQHGADCGHRAVQHGPHVDYLHSGHLHNVHSGHVDEHVAETGVAAEACTGGHVCQSHEAGHRHGAGCGHEALPHGGHADYIVGDHIHHLHGGHCDNHGSVQFS